MSIRSCAVLAVCLALTACAERAEPAAPAGAEPDPARDEVVAAAVASTGSAVGVAPTTTRLPSVTVDELAFTASVHEVSTEELGASWRDGCPVDVADLRRIDMAHHDGDGGVTRGSLVVHADHVDDLIGVFERLYEAGFPIERMEPVSAFDADDDASMAANNTSAFNCREIAGRPGVWSQHAYGGAVDINPLVNPWVRGTRVDPPGGAEYVDRDLDVPGLIRAGDVVTEAFAAIGWGWGGDWSASKDYQHFSHDGR